MRVGGWRPHVSPLTLGICSDSGLHLTEAGGGGGVTLGAGPSPGLRAPNLPINVALVTGNRHE